MWDMKELVVMEGAEQNCLMRVRKLHVCRITSLKAKGRNPGWPQGLDGREWCMFVAEVGTEDVLCRVSLQGLGDVRSTCYPGGRTLVCMGVKLCRARVSHT